ncbi:2-oxo-4-hydroxy-4-carboxy-5-ureidoimidazoline decarboxylase [Kineococcus sp. SYSU DK003]|uniref:2-oxo-4-hydroxy-4-carboxy-5-ureidoimidazoline decarboxylase n=1 Tax=Kineococcus sp. SYSU DK003 TaxID=3383124 RepID=UPI003D7E6308
MDVEELDAVGGRRCEELLRTCCDAPAWAARTTARRPFGTLETLLAVVEEELAATSEDDVDVALAAHPRIGERSDSATSRREQAGALGAGEDVLRQLADGNRRYEEKFGHVYLVFASGRSAEELLAILDERLGNDPATERAVLRRELAKITRLRLERLLASRRAS